MKAFLVALMLIFSLNANASTSEIKCMAAAIWAEARGESELGQIAVGNVVLNRMQAENKTACQIVKAKGQFSWATDATERARAFVKSFSFQPLAESIMNGYYGDPTNGATYFHTKNMRPKWTNGLIKTARIKNHVFWKEPDDGKA